MVTAAVSVGLDNEMFHLCTVVCEFRRAWILTCIFMSFADTPPCIISDEFGIKGCSLGLGKLPWRDLHWYKLTALFNDALVFIRKVDSPNCKYSTLLKYEVFSNV